MCKDNIKLNYKIFLKKNYPKAITMVEDSSYRILINNINRMRLLMNPNAVPLNANRFMVKLLVLMMVFLMPMAGKILMMLLIC